MATQANSSLSPEAYLELERRAEYKNEYVAGDIFAMSGASRSHNRITANISDALPNRRLGSCEKSVADMKVYCAADKVFAYPDVLICCGQPRFHDVEKDVLLNPTIIFEVLSPSTEDYDRGRKSAFYRNIPSLRHYLLVAQDRIWVEHLAKQDTVWTITQYTDLATSIQLPELSLALPLADIYEAVITS